MLDLYHTWVSPLLWLAVELLWIIPAILVLRWPGGPGAILFLVGSFIGSILMTVSTADTFYLRFNDDPLIGWDSAIHIALDFTLLVSYILRIAGVVFIALRVRAMMQRLSELESIATRN